MSGRYRKPSLDAADWSRLPGICVPPPSRSATRRFAAFCAVAFSIVAASAPALSPATHEVYPALSPALATASDADVNVISGTQLSPHVLQNQGTVWTHGDTVVVAYMDATGLYTPSHSYCGLSVSTDGGATFTQVAERFSENGICLDDVTVFYSVRVAKWFVDFLVLGCGGEGVRQYQSTDAITWTDQGCVASSGTGDLPSTWVDNNPYSPYYGRQYVLFNNFDVNGGAPQITYSINDGLTWAAPVSLAATFRRAVKVTGSLGVDGRIFVELMDEGGGGLNGPRQNFMLGSTDGGATWSAAVAQGPTFLGPGRQLCGDNLYFPCMYTSPGNGYWAEMGFGRPGVGPGGVVHYVYSGRTTVPADPGNIYYVRSTDNGATWSAPLQLNTDATTRAQWSPALSVNPNGIVLVSWYDERNTLDDSLQRFSRVSLDNGATWEPDAPLSDVIFPKPLQSDTSIYAMLAGLYTDGAFSDDNFGSVAYHTWTDGRVLVDGFPQQDVFLHKVTFSKPILTVTTLADHDDGKCDADCTLREAITLANTRLVDDIIRFAPGVTGTIQLGSALPPLGSNIALRGPGASLLTVRRNSGGAYRIFTVQPGMTASFSGLTIADGDSSGQIPADGGGIFNDRADVTVTDCVIRGNTGYPGGGIYNRGSGGAASLTLANSTLSQNAAAGGQSQGGAIYNEGLIGGTVTVHLSNCTVSGNTATIAAAAAILNWGQGGTAVTTITNCTFSGNAIYNHYGTLNLANTVLDAGPGGTTLTNDNGYINSQGHNLSSDAGAGLLFSPGDQVNTDPLLDPAGLAGNGGATPTIALQATSSAIDAADPALAPATDQRGFVRVGVPDIGAFEHGSLIADEIFANGFSP